MRLRIHVRLALTLAALLGAGVPVLHSRASAPAAWDGAVSRLLGHEPEPDAGPRPPGTPPQPPPPLYRPRQQSVADPLRELQRLKRRAERLPGAALETAPADLSRFRRLMEQWRGPQTNGRQGPEPGVPPAGVTERREGSFRLASTVAREATVVNASPVAWGKIPLPAGRPVRLEARSAAGGPPFLYLIRNGRQVAFSGEGDGTAAALTHTPEEEGDFQFLVRGRGDGMVGTCDLLLDGKPLFRGLTYGGTAVPAAWAAGDEIQTAHLPSMLYRVVDTVLYAFDGRGRFVGRNDDGGVNGGSRHVMGQASTAADAHVLVAAAGQDPAHGGPVRVYVNRLSRGDQDGDRLADPLEAALGTDPQAVDTDGDGLRDDWELFGVHTPSGDEDLPAYSDPWMPASGASPTRMDLFLELDWMAGADADPDTFRLTQDALWRVVRAFHERGDLALHIDVGQMGAHASRGGQSFDHQDRFYFTGTSPLSMQDLWSGRDHFAASRSHLFAYGVTIDRFTPSLTTTGEMRRIYDNGRVINTADVWNPYYSPGFILCNGTGIYNYPLRQAGILMHELGHCLRLRHGGNHDVNNKPNYLSVMNYLFALPTLSEAGDIDYSRGTLAPLNEKDLDEATGLGFVPTEHLYHLVRGRRRADVRSADNRTAIDWNANLRLDSSSIATDVNGDGRLSDVADFDDWHEARHPTRGFGWIGLNAGVVDWTSYNDSP